MSDEQLEEEIEGTEEHYYGQHGEVPYFMRPDLTFKERVAGISHGIRQPKHTGEHKWAVQQLSHLYSAGASLALPAFIVLVLFIFVSQKQLAQPREFEVTVIDPEVLEEIEQPEPEPVDVEPEIMEYDIEMPDISVVSEFDAPTIADEPISQQPVEITAVRMVKSPVVMKGIYGARSSGNRGRALKAHGGSKKGEDAVLRALRWLKKEQEADGSWPKARPAMTALALLTYLAHGETPGSPEFGETITKAIQYLIKMQEAGGGFPRSYQHEICTYALCEAYAMTKIVDIRDAAEKALDILIVGQNLPSGGFDYGLNGGDRNDTSVMGWAAQALKAGKMAGFQNSGLEEAIKLAVQGFQGNAAPAGGFGYAGPGATGLTGVGVLCMQLLGAGKLPEARMGLEALSDVTFEWRPEGKTTKWNQNYYWYYITQAKFQAQGEIWDSWNRLFQPVLIEEQTIIKQAIEGLNGNMKDIGWWDMDGGISGHTDGPVMNTCLATLQLEVYYRYLPTFKAAADTYVDVELEDEDDDIDIEILDES
ncbi:MAG: terpene cyclase/mutase family protein [Verrucomicrobia bacterium]|nr:terpene cyclase/mutase family protein [Verrucomicrobiota bacterium]MDA1088116.1 terpene cyclase/mutase family protein [Verrucomicrobiota bacterium]